MWGNRFKSHTSEERLEANRAMRFLLPKMIKINILVHDEQAEKVINWLKRNCNGLWLSDQEVSYMTDLTTQKLNGFNEPTMEEILASIRRIISEVDERTVTLYFSDKNDAIRFKLWYKP